MNESIYWGGHYWNYLHNMTILYPDNPSDLDKKVFQNLLISYQNLLPCEICKLHFTQQLLTFPITLILEKNKTYSSSKNGMILWGIIMHNKINKILLKHINIPNNQIGIDYIIKKYSSNNINYHLKNVYRYAINSNTNDTDLSYYSDLFNSTAYFLFYKNIDLVKQIKNKNQNISFKNNKDILTIINAL